MFIKLSAFAAFVLLSETLLLTGCGMGPLAAPSTGTGSSAALRGEVFGGQQPIAGATIQVYSVGTTGDGSVATPLLNPAPQTAANGSFSITQTDYCLSQEAEVYIVATGGNPGLSSGSSNPQIAMMAALGQCGAINSSTHVHLDEVTTIGAVAALYPYMTSYSAVGSTIYDAPLLEPAFTTVNEYANTATGLAPGLTLPAGYYGSSNEIDTLADVLGTCINSAGGVAGDGTPCGNLLQFATPSGTSGSGNSCSAVRPTVSAPTDTIGALIGILKNPTQNVRCLYNLLPSQTPYQPVLSSAPTDWTLPILPIPPAPLFSLAASPQTSTNVYAGPQPLTLVDALPGAAIYYTTDGTTPTAASSLYAGPFAVNASEIVKAIAIYAGRTASPVASTSLAIATAPAATATSTSLSPMNAAILQGGQQSYAYTVQGATAGSYLWNTSGLAGTFQESFPGFYITIPTNSYCSTSGQALYFTSSAASLVATLADTITVQAFSSSNCDISTTVGPPSTAVISVGPATSTIVAGLATGSYSSTVVLPPGTALTPSQVTVLTSAASATPSASGAFTITGYTGGSLIALVNTPNGNTMLMGWLDANHSAISASTTAEVLAYYALGGPLVLHSYDRASLIAAIATDPGLPALAQAVTTEIAANPDALAQPDANLTAALNTFFTSISGFAAQPFARTGPVANPNSVTINGGTQSGLTVNSVSLAQAEIVNAYRRLAHVFVTRVSDTPYGANAVPIPNPGAITDIDVAATAGLNGGFTGAAVGIFNAYFGNAPTAYAPVTTGPLSVPLDSGYAKTTYQFTIVGPGPGAAGLLASLPQTMRDQQFNVSMRGFVGDVLAPLATNLLFSADPDATFVEQLEPTLANDLINLVSQSPALQTKIDMGDTGGAMADILFNGVNGATFSTILSTAITETAAKAGTAGKLDTSKLASALKSFNGILSAVGGALQVLDTSVYIYQLYHSDAADQWTIVSTSTPVTLSPAATTLGQYSQTKTNVILTAAVPGADTTGYSYMWTNTATAGAINVVGSLTTSASFCSSSNQVQYVPNSSPLLTQAVTDTLTVQAFSSANCPVANLLGSAPAATVTVAPTGVTLNPASTTVSQTGGATTGTVPLTATVYVDGVPPTASLVYQWTLTGNTGVAPVGVLNEGGGGTQTGLTFCSTFPTATYVPNASPTLTSVATDLVVVKAYTGSSCPPTMSALVGTSPASAITVTAVSLLLTPHNAALAQTGAELSMSVTATGTQTTGLYYQWAVDAGGTANGTLQDSVTGQTGTIFCTSSKQVTYVPNATPVLAMPAVDIVSVQALSNSSCAASTAVSGLFSTQVTVEAAPSVSDIPLNATVSGLIQASDGNFYASSAASPDGSVDGNSACLYQTSAGYSPPDCGALYRISPGGAVNSVYVFPSSNSSGNTPSPMLEGPDGNLYGLTADGVFFKQSLSGAFTIISSVLKTSVGTESTAYGLILGNDGNFYIPFDGAGIYRLSPGGAVTALYDLSSVAYASETLLQGVDGDFYGITPSFGAASIPGSPVYLSSIFHFAPSTGEVSILAQLPAIANTPLVQGPDGSFYVIAGQALLRISTGGAVNQVSTLIPGNAYSTLHFGSDGNLYTLGFSSFYTIGPSLCTSYASSGANCVALSQISPSGVTQIVHLYQGGADGNYLVPENFYYGGPTGYGFFGITQDNHGNLVTPLLTIGPSSLNPPTSGSPNGVDSGAIPFINDGLPPPIQLSFANASGAAVTTASVNTPVTVNWKVLNGFSGTAQVCYAFLQTGTTTAQAGNWTGKQTGVYTQPIYAGSTTITPTTPGTYTYALTCAGKESGFATLAVQ